MDFTVLGDNVNVTARLASLAGPGEILISDAAYTAAGLDWALWSTGNWNSRDAPNPSACVCFGSQ